MTNSDTPDLFAWAMEYARRGWSLVALHHVEWNDGTPTCTCREGNAERHRAQAGKHPRDSRWQQGGGDSPMRWQQGRANIGIKTGGASGFWVLDFDPDGVDDDDGHALLQRLAGEGYAPHVRTGGGGYHWRFTLPSDFEVRNRQSAGGGGGRTHALPMGWDVRGEGGQVVAPPSVTAKGAYVELLVDKEWWKPYTPPAWLLEMIRPQVRDDPPDHMISTADRFEGLPQPGGLGSSSEHGAGEGSSRPADQVQAYCTAALYAEVEEYGALQDGRRGEAAAAFARTLVELANTAGWPHDAVYRHFEAAMERAAGNAGGGGYAPHEVPNQWERAREHVGDTKRAIPPRVDVLPPFPTAPQAGADHTTSATAAPAASNGGLPIVEPGSPGASTYGVNGGASAQVTATPMSAPEFLPPPVIDPWQRAVAKRVWDDDVRDAASTFRATRDAAGRPSLASRVLTGETLDLVPDPVPLIEGWLFLDSTGRINGRPGQGKSFVAADLLCSVATGTPWAGVPVRQGPVLAIVAEGVSGFKLRIRAWENERGVKVGGALHLIPEPVQTLDPAAWAELVAYAVGMRPALITLDTQARISVGARENDSTDMGRVVAAVEELRRATGACVLLVHHAVKSGDAEGGRGSNAVEGATVSEFYVSKTGHAVTIKTTRQKDIESDAKATFDLKPVDRSAVLVHRIEFIDPSGAVNEQWKIHARKLYEIFQRSSGATGITVAEARNTAAELPEFAEGNSAKRAKELTKYALNNLIMRGLLIQRTRESTKFGVHVMERVGPDGVLTPNVGEWLVADPVGWQTYAVDVIDPNAKWSTNIGKSGGERVSAAVTAIPT